MFDVKIGPTTTEVECPLLEDMAGEIETLQAQMFVVMDRLQRVLDVVEGTPHIEFMIGPVSEQ